jgi:hypothetical protein
MPRNINSRTAVNEYSLNTLLANPTQTSWSTLVKFCDEHPDQGSDVSEDSGNVSVTLFGGTIGSQALL